MPIAKNVRFVTSKQAMKKGETYGVGVSHRSCNDLFHGQTSKTHHYVRFFLTSDNKN